MKKNRFGLIAIVITLFFTACDFNEDINSVEQTSEDLLEARFDMADFMDNMSDDATEREQSFETSNARLLDDSTSYTHRRRLPRAPRRGFRFHLRELIACADFSKTTEGDLTTVVFDFTNGYCANENVTLDGVVTDVFLRRTTDARFHETTFDAFSRNGIEVNGTAKREGTIDWGDINPAEFEGEHRPMPLSYDFDIDQNLVYDYPAGDGEAWTETFVRDIQLAGGEGTRTKDGSASYTNSKGRNISIDIIETLSYDYFCSDIPVYIPLSGIEEISNGEDVVTINYGDGECDYIVEITFNEGETKVVDMSESFDEYGFVGSARYRRNR